MKQIAVIPGDGIGKEVIAAGMDVLEAVSQISSFQFEPEYVDIGSERYLRTGELLTDEDIALLAGPCTSGLPYRIDPRFILANQSEFEYLFMRPSLVVSPFHREERAAWR